MNRLSFFQLYKLLKRHRTLSERRDPIFEANKTAQWVMRISMAFCLLYLAFMAIFLSFAANDSNELTAPEYFMGISPLIILVDFWIRFLIQQTPAQIVKPYILLPISRYACIDCFLINTIFSWGNLTWFILLVPYCFMSVLFSYGLLSMVSLLVLFYLIIIANSLFYSICRTLMINKQPWLLLPLGITALLILPWILKDFDYFFYFYSAIGSHLEHGHILPHLITLMIITIFFLINRKVQLISTEKELKKEDAEVVNSTKWLSVLKLFKQTDEYLKLETKSLMRNKNPKKTFLWTTLAVFILSMVITFTDVYDSKSMANWWCIYNFLIYGAGFLVKIMGYEANYIDCLLIHKENILHLLTAKYYFFCALLIIPFTLMLPMVFVGKWSILMLFAYGIFTAGFQYFVLFQLAVYNKDKIPMNEKITSSGGVTNNNIQMLTTAFAFFLPILMISVLDIFLPEVVSLLIILAIGLFFILTHKIWLRNIYNRMMARKYQHLEAFHS